MRLAARLLISIGRFICKMRNSSFHYRNIRILQYTSDSLCDQSAQELTGRFAILFGNQHLLFIDRHRQNFEPALAEPGRNVKLLVRLQFIQFRILFKYFPQPGHQRFVAEV